MLVPRLLSAETVFTLSPHTVVAPRLAGLAQVVEGETLRESKPIDLASVLAQEIPSVALARRSPLAGDLVLRGLTRDNVLITVDSTKTFCACPNRMDPPAFHVSSQQIEGVTIRQGPFSVEQGATVGGVIFVQTREPTADPYARAYGFAGSYDYWATGLTLGGDLGLDNLRGEAGLYLQAGGVYEDGDGVPFTRFAGTNYRPEFQDADAFDVVTAEVKAAFDLQDGMTLEVGYGYQDATDVLYPGLRMDATVDTMHRGGIGLNWQVAGDWADRAGIAFTYSTVDHEMVDTFRLSSQMNPTFIERGYMMRTLADNVFIGVSLEAKKQVDRQAWRYGLDLESRHWDADNVLRTLENTMIPDVETRSLAAWGVYEKRVGAWSLEAGGRLTVAESEAGDDITFLRNLRGTTTNTQNETLLAAYLLTERELSQDWQLFAGLGYGSRLPDPQERYINLNRPGTNPDWIGNPDLDPVKNTELQLGVKGMVGPSVWHASLFHSWLDDMIYLAALDPALGRATTYENVDARLYGFSVEGLLPLGEGWQLQAGLAWQEGEKTSRPSTATNDVLGEIPPLRGQLGLMWASERFNARAQLQTQADLDRVDPDVCEQTLDGWTTLQLMAVYELSPHWQLSGGIDNLTDEGYAVANAFVRDPFRSGVIVREPGRFIYMRLTATY